MNNTTSSSPFFTVIIATYNAAATVVKSLESVLAQIERPQVILVDGLSKDNTIALARPFEAQGVEIICERDQGVYDAWNKGIAKATGQWIIFLGADDFYADTDCLAILRNRLASAPMKTEVAYGRVHLVDTAGVLLAKENAPWEESKSLLPNNMPFTHVGTAHKATLFERRRFNPSYRIAGDYQFLYPVLRSETPLFVPEYVVTMTQGGLSTAFRSRLRLLNEIISIRQEYSITVSFKQRMWTLAKTSFYRFSCAVLKTK